MFDFDKLAIDDQIKVLEWRRKNNVSHLELKRLLEIMDTKGPGRPKGNKKSINTKPTKTTFPLQHDYRALREQRELTQEEAAQKIGMSKWTYINFEKGRSMPRPDTLNKINVFFGIVDE